MTPWSRPAAGSACPAAGRRVSEGLEPPFFAVVTPGRTVLGFFPSLQIRYQHGGENGDVFDPKARSAEDFGIYLHEQIKHFRGTKLYNLNRTRPSFINATFLSGGSIHEEKTADANATVLPGVLVDQLEKSGSRVTGKTMLGTLNSQGKRRLMHCHTLTLMRTSSVERMVQALLTEGNVLTAMRVLMTVKDTQSWSHL